MSESSNHFGPFQPLLSKLQNTTNHTAGEPRVFHLAATSRIGNAIILTALIVFGVLVNSFMVHMLKNRRVLNKSTTTVLLHLATSDIMACFVVIPMQFVLFVSGIRPNPVSSKAYYILTNFTLSVDCGCHVLLSIDRCCSVKQAQSIGVPVLYFKKVLAAIWVVGIGNAILTALTKQKRNPWLFESKDLDAGTIMSYIFIWFALVALVVALLYVQYKVKKQDKEAGENFGDSSSKKRRKKQIKVLKTTAVVMTSSIILYLPLMLCEYVYRIFKLQSPNTTSFSQILISVSHAINLVIYTGMSKKFRKAAWKELKLHIRRANIRSSLTDDKRTERTRTNSNRQTFSSFIAKDMDLLSPKGSEETNNIGPDDKVAEFSDKIPSDSVDIPCRDRKN